MSGIKRVRDVAAVALTAVALAVASAGIALAAGGMTGELFTGVPQFGGLPTSGTHGTCPTGGASHIAVEVINQPATGPAPGVYNEFGSITITAGVVTGWQTSWSISATAGAEPYERGTKTLQAGGPGSVTCNADMSSSGSASATLNFTATGTIVDSGTATGSITFDTAAKTGTSDEAFGPLRPRTKDDCKDGGFIRFGFANQGVCIDFVHDLLK